MYMTLEQFKKVKPTIQAELEKAILKAAEQHPEGFQGWMRTLSEGASNGRS